MAAGPRRGAAVAAHPDLVRSRVYMSGCPPMVDDARRRAYRIGAALDDIHADPFERRQPGHAARG